MVCMIPPRGEGVMIHFSDYAMFSFFIFCFLFIFCLELFLGALRLRIGGIWIPPYRSMLSADGDGNVHSHINYSQDFIPRIFLGPGNVDAEINSKCEYQDRTS